MIRFFRVKKEVKRMARKTAQAFINQYNGTVVDYDGVYGAQCVDAFKIFCAWLGIPVKPTKTGWADGYWTYRMDFSAYVTFITDVNKLEAGDWLFWKKGSSCPSSHVGMMVSYAGTGYANIFSENQGGNGGFRTVKLKLDILGAFRFKKLEKEPAEAPTKTVKATGVAHSYSKGYAATYYAVDNLNCRNSGSTKSKVLVTVPKNTAVTCYGYYDHASDRDWLYAQATVNGILYTGFFAADYLSRSKVSTAQITVGSKIRIKSGAMQYGKRVGFAAKVYRTTYTVSEISGDRVVFKAGAVVMGAVRKSDCYLV